MGETYSLTGEADWTTAEPVEGYQLSAGFVADLREAAKIDPFVPTVAGDSRPWWERVAEFGLTRAIDSHYGVQMVNKTGTPVTFAGQNGRTYVVAPQQPQQPASVGGVPLLLLAALAAVVLLMR